MGEFEGEDDSETTSLSDLGTAVRLKDEPEEMEKLQRVATAGEQSSGTGTQLKEEPEDDGATVGGVSLTSLPFIPDLL